MMDICLMFQVHVDWVFDSTWMSIHFKGLCGSHGFEIRAFAPGLMTDLKLILKGYVERRRFSCYIKKQGG